MKQYIPNDTNWAARGTPWVHLGTSWFPWEHHRTDHCCKLTIYNGLSELTGGRLSRKTPLNHLAEHYQLLSTNNSFGSCGGPPRAITTKTQGTLTRIDLQPCASFQPNLFSGFGRDECRTDKQIVNLISPITMVIIIKSYTWYKCILPTLSLSRTCSSFGDKTELLNRFGWNDAHGWRSILVSAPCLLVVVTPGVRQKSRNCCFS